MSDEMPDEIYVEKKGSSRIWRPFHEQKDVPNENTKLYIKAPTNNGGDLEFYEGTSPHQVSMFIEHTKKFHNLHPKDNRSAWAWLRYLVLKTDCNTLHYLSQQAAEIEQKDKRIAELERHLNRCLNHGSIPQCTRRKAREVLSNPGKQG